MITSIGLSGCGLFGGEEILPICGEGYTLEGTECVPIDTTGNEPIIDLIGDPDVTILLGEPYTDPGATASDTEDGDITDQIQVAGTVTVDVVGTYVITYNVTDSDGNAAQQVTRTVTVVEAGDNNPEISLLGEAEVTLQTGDAFTDPGATASDIEDGDITNDIVVTGSVNTSESGVYVLTYSITDSDGNTVSVTRTITVQPSEEEVLANYVVDNWDGTLQFLGLTMANMDFSTGMTMEMEANFEVSEDIDETHFINAIVTDSYLYGELNSMKRVIDLEVDGEFDITVSFIFEEVSGGAYIYMEYRPILDFIQQENPAIVDNLSWIGLDSQWALFKVDDSLQNVIQVEVIKDMLVSLFFSEMGEMFFYDVQEQMIEEAIGFDLNQYGVDLGAFVDLLIEEDFTGAQAMLDGVMIEDIVLHLDHMYLAWRLYGPASFHSAELTDAGFDVTKIELLNTATWNELTQTAEVNLPLDPTKGTQAFFNSLTPEELDTFIEIIVKPEIEMMVFGFIIEDINPIWLQEEFTNLMTEHQTFLEENWPVDSVPFVFEDELAELQILGAGTYWYNLTPEEKDVFYWALDQNNVGWSIWQLDDLMNRYEEFIPMLQRFREEYPIYDIKFDIVSGLLTDANDYLNTNYPDFNATMWFAEIEDEGIVWWYHDLPQNQKDVLFDLIAMPEYQAYNDTLSQLSYLAERPWDYQFIYEGHENHIGVNDATWTLTELIQRESQYLMDEYGIDALNLIAQFDLYEHKAVEWFMWYATEEEIDALYDIADNQWEDHFVWTLDQLMDIRMYDWDYGVYYGRMGELYDLQDFENQITQMLTENAQYVYDMYGFDVTNWQNQIMYEGVLAWYDSLDQNAKDILSEISFFSDGWYRWPIEVLELRDIYPWDFSENLCNWDYCIDEERVENDIINLIENNRDYLAGLGYDVDQILIDIDTYGIMQWYLDMSWGDLRRELLDMAKQYENRYEILNRLTELQYKENSFMNFLITHETWLNEIGFDATQKIADLDAMGMTQFLTTSLSPEDIGILMDATVYPIIEGLVDAVQNNEVPEYLTQLIFTDPHVLACLDMLEPTPEFDPFALIDINQMPINMLQVDYDAIALEPVDMAGLLQAIYDGPVAYQTYLDSIQAVAPNAVLILSLLTPSVETLQPYMMFVDDFNYALEGLSLFEPYLTSDYWTNQSGLDLSMEVTPEFYVDTIMVMDPIMYQVVLDDLLGDINTYLSGFGTIPFPYDENWECLPEHEYQCEPIDPSELMAFLTQLGDVMIHVTMDPSNPTWMQYNFDFTDFLNVIVEKQFEQISQEPWYEPSEYNDIINGVNNASITLTISQGAAFDLPAEQDIDVLNDIAYDLGKFSVAMFARDYLRDVMWYYMDHPEEMNDLITAVMGGQTIFSVNEFDFLRTSKAFDNDLSTIGVTLDLSNPLDPKPIFTVTLYWIDGTEALNGQVSLDDITLLFDEFNELLGENAYQTMISFVNDDNFNMTKLWFMFLLQDEDFDNMKYNEPY